MPRGKKTIIAENIAADVTPETAAPAKKARKPRNTKAKATSSANKSADKPTKKVVKNAENKTAAPKTKKPALKAAVNSGKAAAEKSAPSTPKRATRKSTKGTGEQIVVQSGNNEYTFAEITEICKKAYRNGTRKQIKSIMIYLKAEKSSLKAYYVVNDSVNGSVKL